MPDALTALQILGEGNSTAVGQREAHQASSNVTSTPSIPNVSSDAETSKTDKDGLISSPIDRKMAILNGEITTVKTPKPKLSQKDDRGALGTFNDRASSMMTFGLSKPFNAALMAGVTDPIAHVITGDEKYGGDFGDRYDAHMDRQAALEEANQAEHPYAALGGDIAGLVGSLGVALPAKGVQATTQAPGKMAQFAEAHPKIAAAATNTGVGATIGGLNSVGYAKGSAEERAEAGVHGMEAGGLLGLTVPPAVQMVGKAVAKVAAPFIGNIGRTAEEAGMQKVAQAFQRDKITPQVAKQEIGQMGKEAALVDVGGENVKGLARSVAGQPGEGKELATQFFNQRQSGQGGRVEGAMMNGLGSKTNYYDADAALTAQQKLASPLYDEAYKANQVVTSPAINRVLRTPAGQKALKEAAVKMQNDMTLLGVPDKELAEQAALAAGQPLKGGVAKGLKLRTLDYVKRSMDDQIGAAIRAGENDNARILTGMKKSFVKALDEADVTAKAGPNSFKPEGGAYARARKAFSGPAQSRDALETGRKFINEDAELTIRELADMADNEKEMFRIGAARALRDKIQNTPYGSDATKNIFGSPEELFGSAAKRDRLKAVFPDDASFKKFEREMLSEAKMYASRAKVLQGSRTAPMGEEIKDSVKQVGQLVDAAHGNFGGMVMDFGKGIYNRLIALPPDTRDKVAQALFSNDPQKNAQTLHAIQMLMQDTPAIASQPLVGLAAQAGQRAGQITTTQ